MSGKQERYCNQCETRTSHGSLSDVEAACYAHQDFSGHTDQLIDYGSGWVRWYPALGVQPVVTVRP